MKNTSYLLLILTMVALSACQRVIDIDLRNDTGKLVIEGNINDTLGTQTVKLSRNVAFSSTNTYPAVTGATVSISDNAGHNYQLTEGPAGTYRIPAIKGIYGQTYHLNVTTDGKTYTANSTMPAKVALDSVSFREDDFDKGTNKRVVSVHYTDPAGIANQYRFVLYVNGIQIKTVFANNDQFSDGRTVKLDLRSRSNDDNNNDDILTGDRVTVEMQCIDQAVYTYWFALEQQAGNGPGGSVTPSDPPNNISPTALGYFSAATIERKTVTVK